MSGSFRNTGSTLSNLLAGFCEVPPHLDRHISDITIDSREAMQGSCFFALSGSTRRGSDFISDAVCRGATAVVSETQFPLNPPSKVAFLVVPKLKDLIGKISSRFFGDPSKLLKIYAVTGTNGKTTVSYLISRIIGILDGSCGYLGTLGIGLDNSREMLETSNTTPDVITINRALSKFLMDGATSCSLEASSIGLSQGRLNGLDLDTALYTNIGQDHLDYHGSQDAYELAKLSLFKRKDVRNVILNLDDEFGRTISKEIYADKNVLSVAVGSELPGGGRPDISVSNIRCSLGYSRFSLAYQGKILDLKTQLIGGFNVSNVSLSVGALLAAGYSSESIMRFLPEIGCIPGRMQFCGESSSGAFVFVDYAHTPEGLGAALSAFRALSKERVIVVFGCGGDRDRTKRSKMGSVASLGSDLIFLTGDNSRSEATEDIVEEILVGIEDRERVLTIYDRFSAIKAAISSAKSGDIVLIAGKGHETVQEINGKKSEHNDFLSVRKILSEGGYD